MAKRPKKPCAKLGCYKLVEYPNLYCDIHKEYQEKLRANKYKEYNDLRKNDKGQSFYKSKQWVNFREFILSRDNYLCQECLKNKELNPGNLVHHIIPIKIDYSRRLDEANCITVCNSCHEKIHNHRGK